MNVRLRALENKDCDGMMEWMQDEEIMHLFRKNMKDRTREDVLEFIASAKITASDGEDIHYAVVDESDEYLGTISLKSIDLSNMNAEYAISLRRKAWGKGVAIKATREILDMAFVDLGLEKVYLNVLFENYRAVRLYEKCGFIYEGEFRKHLLLEGEYRTLKWYSILKEEYVSGGGNP